MTTPIAPPPFVTTLGVRPAAIVLNDGSTRGAPMSIRVRVAEAWDGVRVDATSETTVRDVKRAALAALLPDGEALDAFVVKLQGAEVRNEGATLAAAGVRNGATLLVMARRRHAVR